MPRLFAGFLIAVASLAASAQDPPRHALYGEIGGSGVFPSVNYERRFTDHVAGRIGLSVIFGESGNDTDLTVSFPVVASFISHPRHNHHFEAGGGILLILGEEQDFFYLDEEDDALSAVAVTGLLGYRYQKPGRGFLFRASATPIYTEGEIFPWLAGLSFGYSWP